MSKIKLLSIAVIGLLVLNLGIVGFLFLRKPLMPHERPNGRPPFESPGPQNEIIASLHFDSIQVRQYEILIDEHRESIKALNEVYTKQSGMLYVTRYSLLCTVF